VWNIYFKHDVMDAEVWIWKGGDLAGSIRCVAVMIFCLGHCGMVRWLDGVMGASLVFSLEGRLELSEFS
jgi:hypothetical protein